MSENITSTFTDLVSGILTEGFIIVAICFVIGQVIKTSKIKVFKKIDNSNIPIITAIIGMLLSLIPDMFASDSIIVALMKGAISGWAATGAYETIRQWRKKKSREEENVE